MSFRALLPLASLLLLVSGCPGGGVTAPGDDDDGPQGSPPTIQHTPVIDGQASGQPVLIEASVEDPDGVSAVSLYYRPLGASAWNFTFMLGDESSGYAAEIPASTVYEPGVEYYIRATDQADPRGEGLSPETAPDIPHAFPVTRPVLPLPLYEGFEAGSLSSIDWASEVQGFVAYNWEVSDLDANSGAYSAFHSEAISGVENERRDWLVSPPLDLSGKDDLVVRWSERGAFQSQLVEHGLYISTGSPDPADGDFEAVEAALPAPPDDWARSEAYSLDAWAGSSPAYLAWFYRGVWADRWLVDDVYVGARLPELAVDGVDLGDLVPGATGPLLVDVSNVGATGSASLDVTLSAADERLSPAGTATLPALGAGESHTLEGLTLEVDAAHPDNAWLDLSLELTDGIHGWSLPFRALLGQESFSEVQATPGLGADLALTLRHGSEADGGWSLDEALSAAGSWRSDITAQAELLPPAPGERRWSLLVSNPGVTEAVVDDWVLEVGGEAYRPVGLPLVVDAGGSGVLLLPEIPQLFVSSVSTTPSPVAPGTVGVMVSPTLGNDGPSTQGPLSGVVTSLDPDVTLVDDGPLTFGAGPLAAGETVTAGGVARIDVSSDHIDGSPLELSLELSDGADSFSVPLSVEVPFAHPTVAGVLVDDAGGDGDGIPEVGEPLLVTLEILNDGDLPTAGPVTLSVAPAGDSSASFTLATADTTLGDLPLDAGETRPTDAPLALSIDAGFAGDLVRLEVAFDDGVTTWTEVISLEVSPLPWLPLTPVADAAGDAGGYPLDIAQGYYKSDGTVLWVRFDAHAPFEPATAYFVVYFYVTEGSGWWAAEFAYEEWTLESGLFGDDVEPVVPLGGGSDGTSVTLRVALEDLSIFGSSVRIGGGSGFCGSATYYCDLSPEGWISFDLEEGRLTADQTSLSLASW